MIILFTLILVALANAYTVLQETLDQVYVHAEVPDLVTLGFIPEESIIVDTDDDTQRACSTVVESHVPDFTSLSPIGTWDVPGKETSSSDALWVESSSSDPCLVVRQPEQSPSASSASADVIETVPFPSHLVPPSLLSPSPSSSFSSTSAQALPRSDTDPSSLTFVSLPSLGVRKVRAVVSDGDSGTTDSPTVSGSSDMSSSVVTSVSGSFTTASSETSDFANSPSGPTSNPTTSFNIFPSTSTDTDKPSTEITAHSTASLASLSSSLTLTPTPTPTPTLISIDIPGTSLPVSLSSLSSTTFDSRATLGSSLSETPTVFSSTTILASSSLGTSTESSSSTATDPSTTSGQPSRGSVTSSFSSPITSIETTTIARPSLPSTLTNTTASTTILVNGTVSSGLSSVSTTLSSNATSTDPPITGVKTTTVARPSFSSTLTETTVSGSETSDSGASLTSWSSYHASATVFVSSTVTNDGGTTSALETMTTTFVTSWSGSPTTITSVIVGPSGSLNSEETRKRNLPSGAIAAIAIVSSLAVIAVVLWVLIALRRRRKRDMHREYQNYRYSVRGRSDSTLGGTPGMQSLRSSVAFGSVAYYGRGRSNSSGMPIRTSPLEGEYDDPEVPHSASAYTASGGHGSLEGGFMKERSSGTSLGAAILPGWGLNVGYPEMSHPAAERIRGGYMPSESPVYSSVGNSDRRVREQSLLDAAGLGSGTSAPSVAPLQPRSFVVRDPSNGRKKASFTIGIPPPGQRTRSASPPYPSNSPSSMYALKGEVSDVAPNDSRASTFYRRNSASAAKRMSLPPSAWPVIDNSRGSRKEKEDSPSSSRENEPNTETTGRVRAVSSAEFSSGHGHDGHGSTSPCVTSSQGHGSSTVNSENVVENSPVSASGSGTSGSHPGSNASRNRTKRRSNSEDGGFFARAASMARSSLRTRSRRASASGLLDIGSSNTSVRTARPPPPVSRLVIRPASSTTPVQSPTFPTTPQSMGPTPVFERVQSPGSIDVPPRPSSMMLLSGTRPALSAIQATPPPLSTPDRSLDGLLDPRLAARLREIRDVQSSVSTIGLRDNEDYSRPIRPLVNNRDSMTSASASSEYSQPSRPESEGERTPIRTDMVV